MTRAGITSWAHLREAVRDGFWVVPAVCVTVAVALALVLGQLDLPMTTPMLFPGGPASARSFLSSITSAMISVTGLVFSITIVALQLAAGQFSSRVMRSFLRDGTIKLTFGVFVATFTYTMVLQRSVRGTGVGGFVPQLGVSVAFLLVLASVTIFVVYINHIANAIRIANIVDRIGDDTRAVLEVRHPTTSRPNPPLPSRPPDHCLPYPRPGVIVSVNEAALVARAADMDAVFALVPRVGDYVPAGAPLLDIHGPAVEAKDLLRHVAFDTEHTYEQDVAFGFRELVDIAEHALSPAVNDPTTAAQAIDVLHDLLRRVASRPDPPAARTDATATPRLVIRGYTFSDLLDLALEEIHHYGAHDVQTPRRLHTMLTDLHAAALPEHRPPVQHWLDILS